jgi:acetyl esterase/lipase
MLSGLPGKPMMRILSILVALLTAASATSEDRQVIPLWGDSELPFSKPHSIEEYQDDNCWGGVPCILQVVSPTLTLYLPDADPNGTAVLILPGGGYEAEAVYHEGYEIAEALAQQGSVAAVLKYRLPNPETATEPWRVPEIDVRQALQLLRTQQSNLEFTATKFGVMGFSAGGHLAASVSVHRSLDPSGNPDFSILVYGVSIMNASNREWLEQTLYHRPMTDSEVQYQTLLEHVDETTPPAFLAHAFDDDVVPYQESTLYAEALQRHGVAAEIHMFARGGHGFGPGRDEDGTSQWVNLAADWLERLGAEQ